ncbi:MAG: sigma-70 family RNA polymerase sigma factor [Planctomycetota bacterium]|nr:sigma-70 family RNA polymerase sigma factor [Planctomycetota bacterium]
MQHHPSVSTRGATAAREMPAAGRLSADIFAELATAHRQRVLRFATAFLGDRHLAEDIVQEALKRLFEHRHRYRLEELFGTYLVKTAARLCIDHRRSRQAEQRRIASLQAATAVSPAAAAETREVADRVAEAVANLPDRERGCRLLTVCEGLSYRDTAETLGLSYAEVNNAIHRARTQLRSHLGAIVEGQR